MTSIDLGRLQPEDFKALVRRALTKIDPNSVAASASSDVIATSNYSFAPNATPLQQRDIALVAAIHARGRAATDPDWLLSHINSQIREWRIGGFVHQQRRITEILFLTNADCMPAHKGRARSFEELTGQVSAPGTVRVWLLQGDFLERVVLEEPLLKHIYAPATLNGELVTQLSDVTDSAKAAAMGQLLAQHEADQLIAQQWVRLTDSGYGNGAKLSLAVIGMDLRGGPISASDERNSLVARSIIDKADQILRFEPDQDRHRATVLIGGPGQGKSTLAQLICHAYRVSFLGPDADLASTGRNAALQRMQLRMEQLQLQPRLRRWPIYVPLTALADAIAAEPDLELGKYLATIATSQDKGRIPNLWAWLRAWPHILVLDGLDEVPSDYLRARILTSLRRFLKESRRAQTDLYVVATTRPQGYNGEFDELLSPDVVHLQPLAKPESLGYASALINAHLRRSDPQLATMVEDRVQKAASSPTTSRLMSTPLQVTIMCALAERNIDIPDSRHELFDAYYNTVYVREQAKDSQSARMLGAHRAEIDWLHERVAHLLQQAPESGALNSALLPDGELRSLMLQRLVDLGHSSIKASQLSNDLIDVATQRLVLLVQSTTRGWGFEVRSLQEYMAARAIARGSDMDVLSRLSAILPFAYWRNTWLLAFARLYASRDHMRSSLINILVESDLDGPLSKWLNYGAEIACDIYLDGSTYDSPAFKRSLIDQVLRLIHSPAGPSLTAASRALSEAASEERPLVDYFRDVVAREIDMNPHGSARTLLYLWKEGAGPLTTFASSLLAKLERRELQIHTKTESVDLAQHLMRSLGASGRQVVNQSAMGQLLKSLRGLQVQSPPRHRDLARESFYKLPGDVLRAASSSSLGPEDRALIAEACNGMSAEYGEVAAFLRQTLQRANQ